MKPVFKCDYCNFMGTEEEVREHEPKCWDNYDRKSCLTCKHKVYKGFRLTCDLGKEIPEGRMYEFCPQYERQDKDTSYSDMINNLFGGIK